ncbi:unnamed protein product, partial [Polarella glacialis]
LAWPQVRARFRDFVVSCVRNAVRGSDDGGVWWGPEGLRYTSLGSGQLLFDLEILERLRYVGVRIAQIDLVDSAYEGCPPSVDLRRALREFADWQRAAAQLCRHEPAEIRVFSSLGDYFQVCCGSSDACDLILHADAAWPGADEECEQFALRALVPGGLLARLSNSCQDAAAPRDTGPPELTVAGTVEGGECSGHSLAPLRAAAW